ncbi:MAG: ABC transporter permease subunit [Candidatus Bathyarchaeota archaeon]|nr:ABC transporter permease subunit [Candidatus Bathyarchaeota archaeon]
MVHLYRIGGIVLRIAVLVATIIFVLLPSVFVVSFIPTNWDEIRYEIFDNPIVSDTGWKLIQSVLIFSFKLSLLTVLIDIALGIPLAYMLAYGRFLGKSILDMLISLPLVIPTSGFGFATLISWTTNLGLGGLLGLRTGIVDITSKIPVIDIPVLLLLVHTTLTLPYVIKPLQARFLDIKTSLLEASRILGANPFTSFRKVILPLSLPALLSGSIMALTRSLGETGATMIVSGTHITAAVAVVRWEFEFKIATASFLGALLILLTWAMILPLEMLLSRRRWVSLPKILARMDVEHRIIALEEALSSKLPSMVGKAFIIVILSMLMVLPIVSTLYSAFLYWSGDPFTGRVEGGIAYQIFVSPAGYGSLLSRAMLTSFLAAGLSTFISVCISIPLVYLIEKYSFGRILRAILKIPLVIPTSALGISSMLLWGPRLFNVLTPGIWLIILTHIVFSVPVVVESIIAVFEGSDIRDCEDVARTLGAKPIELAELISIPMLRRGILTGAILSFTHSLGETGATFIVMGGDYTVSTLVVTMVESLAIPAALFSTLLLVAFSLVFISVVRVIAGG